MRMQRKSSEKKLKPTARKKLQMNSEISDNQVIEEQNDIEMMQRPHLWPYGRVLPLIRANPEAKPFRKDYGCLLALRRSKTTIWCGDMVEVIGMLSRGQCCETKMYDSFQAIYDDGWRVD